MPSALDEILKKHRQRIIEREEQAFRELLAAYDGIARELRGEIRKLQEKIDAAQAAGETISPSWFARERRLKSLLEQVERQIVRFGSTAAQIIEREQRAAVTIAADQARETLSIIAGDNSSIGSLLPTRVVETAVGTMGDGSPILNYFEKNLAPAVAEKLRSEIVRAAALGTDFRTIANRLMAAGDITRHRALSTARTEVNRVRRETTRQIYQENSDVITGWEWVAAKSSRTCPACLALDGRIFKLEDVFPQHINCRCTLIPVIDGVERPKRVLGAEWFDRQPDEVKEKILGKEGAAAYNEGLVQLKDFVGWRNSKEFGRSIYTRPLSRVLPDQPIAAAVIRMPQRIAVDFDDDNIRDALTEILGVELSDDEIGGLVGALDGARINVSDFGEGIYFSIQHPLISQQVRVLNTDWRGRLFMHNEIFRTSKTAPKGTGLKSFATQVFHAKRFGIKYIDTHAVGDYLSSLQSYRWNGYYTWARVGYNAPLGPEDWAKFPLTFRGIPDLNDLFLQLNGKFV